MKGLMRLAAVQVLLAALVAGYLRLLFGTLRWNYRGLEGGQAVVSAPEGVIILFWHGRIITATACRGLLGSKPRFALVSLSRDGAFIARAAEWVGVPTIRGSMEKARQTPTNEAQKPTSKGGAQAFWRLLTTLADGAAAIITPDGPRGPSQRMSLGAVRLAQMSGAPVLLCGFDSAPAIAARSWDAARFPLPFSRAALVVDGPHRVGEADADLEAVRADWEARLRAAQDQAGAMLR
jgi:lysophospholipid acyltransferase (LPLAT)-like uncharacterized protein